SDAIHPEDRERVLAAAKTAQASGKYAEEYRIIRRDGDIRWIRDRAFPVLGDDGEVYRIAGLAADITQSRKAGDDLRESERRFSDLLGNVELVSLMLDREARITYCNEYLLRLTGWLREEVIGRNWFELFIPADDKHARDVFASLLADGPEAWHHDNEILTRTGERRLVRWNNSVLRSGGGDVIGTASIGEDITERREAEAKIQRLNRVYAVLSGIGSLIVRVRDRQELFDEACRIAIEQGKFAMAWIGTFDPRTQEVTAVARAGHCAEELTRDPVCTRDEPPRGQGAVGRAIRERRPVFNNDISADSLHGPRESELLRTGFRSKITLPLFEAETIVGTLTMYAKEANFFDAEEVELLTGLARNISFAVENIHTQHKVDKLSRIRAVSSEINAAIVRIHDRRLLLEQTCRIVHEHGKFELVWIGEIDQGAERVETVTWTGFSADTAGSITWDSIKGAGGILAETIRNGKPTVRNHIASEVSESRLRQEALQKGCGSALCLPLIVNDLVVAMIVLFAQGHGFFDEEELALLDEVAADVSFALQGIEKQKKLNYLSYYDVLTGLANRSLFLERVAQYMRGASSGGHKLALYQIDLERFKNINDSLGQSAGDALLKQVAEWLTRTVGDANLLARVGADHFAVVMPQVKEERGVARLLEKQMAAFLDHPFRLNDSVFRIATKVGVALFPDDGADADTLFRNAEAALKKAKARGERYLFYTQQMTEAVAGKLTLENQLRQALDNEEYVLHYQPKINLATGLVTSAEALIRWNDPRTGLVPPARFIPVLEETGLIYEVGRWALRKAIADYVRWRAAGLAAVRIAVNVSPLQLRNTRFIAELEQVIGVDSRGPAGLELEITESVIMADVKHNIASLHAIRAMGVTIAIDDFGTGFSSLSYLAKLPVDTLKIDRSFVIDMT
ncbi:MAG: response regulator receiver modulated sensor-containing diguanylate, partial [Betaproteobacteria bacterium]|nr:response regulator receiver modulated sensor-containing diguanylate [Betaproteobacteria bacterium]